MDNEAKYVGMGLDPKPKNFPTPKTLNQAIRHGMMIGPMSKMDESIEAHVKDYLAQKFQAAIFKAASQPNKETAAQIESALARLFEIIVK